ncbi:N-acetyltransferase ESCO1-like, partial [Tropilaelaps mercedesae]
IASSKKRGRLKERNTASPSKDTRHPPAGHVSSREDHTRQALANRENQRRVNKAFNKEKAHSPPNRNSPDEEVAPQKRRNRRQKTAAARDEAGVEVSEVADTAQQRSDGRNQSLQGSRTVQPRGRTRRKGKKRVVDEGSHFQEKALANGRSDTLIEDVDQEQHPDSESAVKQAKISLPGLLQSPAGVRDPRASKQHSDIDPYPEEELPPEETTEPPAKRQQTTKKQPRSRRNQGGQAKAILTGQSQRPVEKNFPCIVIDSDSEEKPIEADTRKVGSEGCSVVLLNPLDVVTNKTAQSRDEIHAEGPINGSTMVTASKRLDDSIVATQQSTSGVLPSERGQEALGADQRERPALAGKVRETNTAVETSEKAEKTDPTLTVSSGTRPKAFYGNNVTAGRLSPSVIRERLQALSFTGRPSFVPTPDRDRLQAKSRKVKKRVGIVARKFITKKAPPSKTAKHSRGCCRSSAREPNDLQSVPATIITLRSSPRKLGARNRFFKHHHPIGNLKIYFQGGVIKVAPHSSPAPTRGLIDFDFKDNNISHLAEEGGKCDNFGLKSVDDLERSGGDGGAGVVLEQRARLRKRKAPAVEGKKAKRRRPSMWRYDEKRSPVKRIPAGLTLDQYEDDQVRERFGFANVWVRLERLPETKPSRRPRADSVRKRLSMLSRSVDDLVAGLPLPVIKLERCDAKAKVASSQANVLSGLGRPTGEPTSIDVEPVTSPLLGSAPASPCPSPLPAASAGSLHLSTQQATSTSTPKPSAHLAPPPSSVRQSPVVGPPPPPAPRPRKKYNPADDAFGFDRIDTPPKYRVRRMVESLFVVKSPEKRPKELTPKLQKNSQPTLDALLRRNMLNAVSTPATEDVLKVPSPLYRKLNPQLTSTPFDSAETKGKKPANFYGTSSSSFGAPTPVQQRNVDGFSGFRRLLDRLGKRQMQIDAGQVRFGATACTRCGMVFSQGEADDERQHEKFHRQILSAVRFKGWNNGNVLDIVPELGTVYLVRPQDVKYVRDKVAEVMKLANRFIGFDWEYINIDPVNHPDRRYAIFATNSGTLASIVVTEPWKKAIRTVPGEELLVENNATVDVRYSVMFVWTFPPYRRRGLASRLLFHLRVQLAGPGNEPLTFDEIAFSDPTPDLHKFVRALTESETYLVAV